MKRILALFAAVAAVTLISQSNLSETQAQGFVNGYQFGAGLNSFGGCGVGGFNGLNGVGFVGDFSREQPPYFATFPPVYYSHVVKRPYGISPYAAPAGIAPVEMNYAAPVPATIHNPYFEHPIEAPIMAIPAPQEKTFTNGQPDTDSLPALKIEGPKSDAEVPAGKKSTKPKKKADKAA